MKGRDVALSVAGVIVVLLLLIYWSPNVASLFHTDHMVSSTLDHEQYVVEEQFENKQEAANIIARLNQMLVRVITHLKRNRMNSSYAEHITYLSSNFNPCVIGEHLPTDLKYTSYVAQKGIRIRLCLRTAEDRNTFHDFNTLTFVSLHELSHLAVRDYGHSAGFWDVFRFILLEASAIGEIKLVDYSKHPQKYCGLPSNISDNPAIDKY